MRFLHHFDEILALEVIIKKGQSLETSKNEATYKLIYA